MQAFHIIKVALIKIRHRHTRNVLITGSTANLLNIIDKGAGWSHMIHTVNIADIHPHTESFRSNDYFFLTLLKSLYNFGFLLFILFTIIRCHPMPVSRIHPGLQFYIYTSGKRIINDSLMPVQKILHPGGNSTLLGLIVGFPLLYGHGGNVKADIFTLHRAHIQGTRSKMQRPDGIKNHIVPAFGIPHSSGRQCKNREYIPQRIL